MTDGRDFEWTAMTENTVAELIDDGIYAERFVWAIADEILDYLGKIVKDELAAEYDRGYETAMLMERPVFDAWEVGYETTKKYYHDLWRWRNDGCPPGGKPEKPRNPYQ